MATNTAPEPREHPPLARDSEGNPVRVPDGTCALRLCRKTTGRPKKILGPDHKEQIRFGLRTTVEEILKMCGPDTYRVYALDDVGEVLDFVTELDLSDNRRALRNAASETPHGATNSSMFAASTDLRFALDAIVQMMRVNGEALRAVTVAQADWVKSIASSRGFFRNGPPMLPEPPRPANDEEDDDDDDTEPPKKGIYNVLAPIAEQLAPAVGPLVTMLTSGAKNTPPATALATTTVDLASRPNWEMRDLVDFKYAGAKAKAKKDASQAQPEKGSLQARVMSNPKLLSHFIAIQSFLSPDEQAALAALANRITALEREHLITEIEGLPAAGAATFLRALLDEMALSSNEASSNNQP